MKLSVEEYLTEGAPEGTRVYLPTWFGAVLVGYVYEAGGLWVHAPEDNAGFGMSYAVHRGTQLEARLPEVPA